MTVLRMGILATVFASFLAAFAAPAAADHHTLGGTFTEQKKKIKGTWSVVEKDDGVYVVLSDDFKTRRAPDLKIFLSTKAAGDITGKNATDGSALVAELTSAKGGQSYKLPAGVTVDDYASIVIHCEQYSVLWGAANLR